MMPYGYKWMMAKVAPMTMSMIFFVMTFLIKEISCDHWDLGDLSHVSWSPVTSRHELHSSLEKGVSLIQVSVDNGTQYLHTGGDLHSFLPIVVGDEDSSPTSDLTLQYALKQVTAKANKKTGLHIKFLRTGIITQSLDVLREVMSHNVNAIDVPVFLEVNVVSASPHTTQPLVKDPHQTIQIISKIPGVTPVLGWATYHGNDKVWKSLADSGVLTRFQLLRVRRIIETLWLNPTTIKDTDVRFLNLMSNKLESQANEPQHSFSHLVISHLLSAIKTNGYNGKAIEDPYSPRRAYRPPRKDPIREILPDYYINTEGYTESQVDQMIHLSKNLTNVGFALRAGMLKTANSTLQISRLLRDDSSRLFIVSKRKMDKEKETDIYNLFDRIGRKNVLLEMNTLYIDDKDKDLSRVPAPRDFSSLSSETTISSNFIILNTILALSYKKIYC